MNKRINKNFFTRVQKILYTGLGRCYVLYLLAALILVNGVDHRKVIFKTLDAFRRAEMDVIHQARGKDVMQGFVLRDAIRYYRNIVALIPEVSLAHSLLGFCYYQAREYEKAITHYTKAVELDGEYLGLHYNLGVLYFQTGDYAKAIGQFQKVFEAPVAKTLIYAGLISPFPGTPGHDEESFRASRLKMLKDTYTSASRFIVRGYQQLQMYEPLLKESLKAIRRDLDDKDYFFYHAALAAFHLKDYPKTVQYCSYALEVNPENSRVYDYLGKAFEKQGLKALARDAFARAQALEKRQSAQAAAETEKPPGLFVYVIDAKEYFRQAAIANAQTDKKESAE